MSVKEKAIENIRAVIEQQETEWLKENGFEPVPHRPELRKPASKKPGAGQFSANRFLGTSEEEPAVEPDTEKFSAGRFLDVNEAENLADAEPENDTLPETEQNITQDLEPDTEKFSASRFLDVNEAEAQAEPEADNEPEIIEIIKQKDTQHSWLYNEVVKAISDVSGDGRNTKVIAIFIPVVQNGKEFEDLPVNASVELPPVDEENLKSGVITENTPEDLPIVDEPDTLAEDLPAVDEPDAPAEDLPAVDEPDTSAMDLPIVDEPVLPDDDLAEIPEPDTSNEVVDLLPEPVREPDPELAAAFRNIVENFEETASEEVSTPETEDEPEVLPTLPEENAELPEITLEEEPAESESEVLNFVDEPSVPDEPEWEKIPDIEIISVPDLPEAEEPAESVEPELVTEPELPDSPELQDFTADQDLAEDTENAEEYIAGQPLAFTEIPLPDELDDDEIFDESELEKEKH